MHDNSRKPNYRKIIIGVLVGVVGASLSGVVLLVALGALPVLQEIRNVYQDVQGTPKVVKNPRTIGQEVRRDAAEESVQDVELVDIIPFPRNVRFLDLGESTTISVSGLYSDSSRRDVNQTFVTYTSSNPSVVRVAPDGTITAVEVGDANIVVGYQGMSTSVPVTVYGNRYWFPLFDQNMVGTLPDSETLIVLNRVMVELKPGQTSNDAQAVAAEINGKVLHSFRTFPGHLIEFDIETNPLNGALAILKRDPRVDAAYPDELIEVIGGVRHHNRQASGHDPSGFNDANSLLKDIPDLAEVKVAIIDTGILFPILHPHYADSTDDVGYALRQEFDWSKITPFNVDGDLEDLFEAVEDGPEIYSRNHYINEGRMQLIALQTKEPDRWEGSLRKNEAGPRGHGTAVASVFNSRVNRGGSSRLDPVIPHELQIHFAGGPGIEKDGGWWRFLSRNEAPAVTAALEYIEANKSTIDVVNMSFVFTGQNRWLDLIKRMEGEVTFVVGAGNDGKAVTGDCKSNGGGVVPARWSLDTNNVITVGATNESGTARGIWGDGKSSNFGCAVSIAARGTQVSIINVMNKTLPQDPNGWGTSLASATVTAAVAMLKAIKPTATPAEIKKRLTDNADPIEICTEDKEDNVECPESHKEQWLLLRVDRAVSSLLGSVRQSVDPLPTPVPTSTPTVAWTPGPTVTLSSTAAPSSTLGPEPVLEVPPGHSIWTYEPRDVSDLDVGLNRVRVDLERRDGVLSVRVDRRDIPSTLAFMDFLDADSGVRLWRFQPVGGNYAILEGVVYADFGEGLEALNTTTGERLWNYETNGRLQAVVDGNVYVDLGESLEALNATTGERLWSHETYGGLQAVVDGNVYVDSSEMLEVVDATTGENIWNHKKKEGSYGGAARTENLGVVQRVDALIGYPFWGYKSEAGLREIEDGVAYIWENGELNALTAMTGKQIWRHENVEFRGAKNGVAYVSDEGLSAVNAATGEPLWRYEFDDSERFYIYNIRAIIDGVVYVESSQSVYAVDATTGEQLWSYHLPAIHYKYTYFTYAVYADERVMFLGGVHEPIHAVNAATGEPLWQYQSDAYIHAVMDGVVYAVRSEGDRGYYLDALDATTGKLLWGEHYPAHVNVELAVEDGVAYVTSSSKSYSADAVGSVYALKAATGRQLWEYPVGLSGHVNFLRLQVMEGGVYLTIAGGVPEGEGIKLSGKFVVHAIQR